MHQWTPLTPDAVGSWATLVNLVAEVDQTEEFYSPEDLAEELDADGFDPHLDSWSLWESDGTLGPPRADAEMIAYGKLTVGTLVGFDGRVRVQLEGAVHPLWRGRGIGRELLDLMEARADQLLTERHGETPAYLRASGGLDGSSVRALLAHRGFSVARYFHDLRRPLPGDAVQPVEPAGFTLACPRIEDEEAMRLAFNVAFADHWGSGPSSPGRWHDFWKARANRFELSTLVWDADQQVASFVMASQWVEGEAYIGLVGTLPQVRGQGLATAALDRTIDLARQRPDLNRLTLEVDSNSPTGAGRLYERAGFTLARTLATMMKDVR